jgi:hypothetical protein
MECGDVLHARTTAREILRPLEFSDKKVALLPEGLRMTGLLVFHEF